LSISVAADSKPRRESKQKITRCLILADVLDAPVGHVGAKAPKASAVLVGIMRVHRRRRPPDGYPPTSWTSFVSTASSCRCGDRSEFLSARRMQSAFIRRSGVLRRKPIAVLGIYPVAALERPFPRIPGRRDPAFSSSTSSAEARQPDTPTRPPSPSRRCHRANAPESRGHACSGVRSADRSEHRESAAQINSLICALGSRYRPLAHRFPGAGRSITGTPHRLRAHCSSHPARPAVELQSS